MDIQATDEAYAKLFRHLGVESLDQACDVLHIDHPFSAGGRYRGPEHPNGPGDIYGIRRRPVAYETGTYSEVVRHPLAEYGSVGEIEENYTWPDPDWWTYDHLPAAVGPHPDRPVRGGGSEPFLTYCHLRGQERGYMDLALNPDMVHHCLDKLFGLAYENTKRIYEAIPGKVTFSYVAEDLGSQEALLFSPAQIREFLLPRMKRMMDLVHEHGGIVFTHSDGAIRDIIPDLIEIGMDVLNPVQWRCAGMDREGLKRDFGDRIAFHGAMDNQHTLAFGTVEEVRQEVRDNVRILGEGGGYVLAPCHNIQAVGPPENVVAMYETGYALSAG
jgi:uroporphyrinogen decarboxylase